MTDEEHNKYVAWAFLANGLFQSAILLFVFLFLIAIFLGGGANDPNFPGGLIAAIFGFVLIVNLVMLSPNFVAAYALLKRKPWARIAGIVAAAMAAMNVPLGTLAAVYSLWFFCGDQWKSVYQEKGNPQFDKPQISPAHDTQWEGYTKEDGAAFIYRTPPPPDWR